MLFSALFMASSTPPQPIVEKEILGSDSEREPTQEAARSTLSPPLDPRSTQLIDEFCDSASVRTSLLCFEY